MTYEIKYLYLKMFIIILFINLKLFVFEIVLGMQPLKSTEVNC